MSIIGTIDFSNQFYVERIDLDTFDFPKLEVKTWSNLFGEGGSYTVEATATDVRKRIDLMSVAVKGNEPSTRRQLEELVEEWNEDPYSNWVRIIRKNAESVARYRRSKADDIQTVLTEAAVAERMYEKSLALPEEREAADV